MATVCIEAHLKKGYDEWKTLFDADGVKRAAMCDESKTTVGKVSEDLAIVMLHNVNMEASGSSSVAHHMSLVFFLMFGVSGGSECKHAVNLLTRSS